MSSEDIYSSLRVSEPSENLRAVMDYWANEWIDLPVRDLANLTFLTEVHGLENDLYSTEWDRRVFGGVNSPEFENLIGKDAEIKDPEEDNKWFAETPPLIREPKISSEIDTYTADVEMTEEVGEALDETTSFLQTQNIIYRDSDTGGWNLDLVDLRNEVYKTDEFEGFEVDHFSTY